jgi:hypothetical protein
MPACSGGPCLPCPSYVKDANDEASLLDRQDQSHLRQASCLGSQVRLTGIHELGANQHGPLLLLSLTRLSRRTRSEISITPHGLVSKGSSYILQTRSLCEGNLDWKDPAVDLAIPSQN